MGKRRHRPPGGMALAWVSRARVVDAGRIVTAGGIASGMGEMGFTAAPGRLRLHFINDVARVMEYHRASTTLPPRHRISRTRP